MDVRMKRLYILVLILLFLLCCGCSNDTNYDIVATTLPVYDFTTILCEGTPLSVGRLVTESVSCLHDYYLQVDQMRMIEGADAVVISGVDKSEDQPPNEDWYMSLQGRDYKYCPYCGKLLYK